VTDTDNDIIESIRAGEVRRFGELVDRHKDRALTLAVRIVGNRQEAEELVQDAFVRAYRGLPDFRGDAKFSTWFYRIVSNACMTRALRRSERDSLTEPREDMDGEVPSAGTPDPTVLDLMEGAETMRMLQEELGKLPEHYRAVMTLFYVQEMGHEEMSGVLQMPVGTIKTHLFRGRVALRERVVRRMKRDEVMR
jgi:RNA polymerase sigma-70 factor, ECF subfamily